ncbi:tRNA lysidine(34) synthetase TilS [Caldithrix abyssi]
MSGVQVPAPLLFFIGIILRKTLIKRFKSFCLTNRLISPHDLIVVALSGGMDSMALLHAFLAIRQEFDLQIRALHVNHGIRGAEAERDEQMVRAHCQALSVPLIVRRIESLKKMDEQTLRNARYREFEAVLKDFPGAKLATAHTLDDNVETFLMRLAKGSSLKGLGGIPARRGLYIRPFLFLTRREVEAFVEENQIPFVKDSTNADVRYLRNRIRLRLMPAFMDVFGEAVLPSIAKSVEQLAEYYRLFEAESKKRFERLVKKEGASLLIDKADFNGLHPLYRRQILTYCVSAYYPLNYNLSERKAAVLETFARTAQTGARFSVIGDLILIKERKRLRFTREPERTKTVLELNKNGSVKFGEWEITIQEVEKRAIEFEDRASVEYICGDNLRFPLSVRRWQKGDRFYPLGLGKSKKLKDFFVDAKIDRFQKHNIPILLNGEEIVWLCGLRLDHRYRVTESCRSVFKLEIKKMENVLNEKNI